MTNWKEAMDNMSKSIDELKSIVIDLSAKIDRVDNSLEELKTTVTNLSDKLDTIDNNAAVRNDEMKHRVNQILQQLMSTSSSSSSNALAIVAAPPPGLAKSHGKGKPSNGTPPDGGYRANQNHTGLSGCS